MNRHRATAGGILLTVALLVGLSSQPWSQAAGDQAELDVDVVPSVEEVVSGSNVGYTITITNDTTTAAAAFTVVNELPEETSFVSCVATAGGRCGGSGNDRSIRFDTLGPETTATVEVIAAVRWEVADGTELVSTTELLPSVTDPEADEMENEAVFVTVLNPPPAVTQLRADPSTLWPPNHKWVDVGVSYAVVDNCGPVVTRVDVASDEPVNATGDGDTEPDWQVVDAHRLRLRAERAGGGDGRVYKITVTATDSAGQTGSAATQVLVPHSRRR